MKFDLQKNQSSIIKVIGVGGGGSNAVNHMFEQGIKGVDFMICNTDAQALDISPVPLKIQLGASLTEGRGAGSIAEVGKNAAIENIDEVKEILSKNTKMVFVTAGMGGGTGTGAAPVIAAAAKEMGILTVGIVTVPFMFEGRKRRIQAEEGLKEIRKYVDTLLVINNDRLREMYGNLSLDSAFAEADNVLATAAKGIAEVITVTGKVNVDFEDVRTVMTDSGVAIMGSAQAEGENRAINAVENALSSPLLNDNHIMGADYVLLNITYGNKEVMMDEISDITDYIQDEAGLSADVIWGHGFDETLGDKICVTIIATGFKSTPDTGVRMEEEPTKKYHSLEDSNPTKITQPISAPTEKTVSPIVEPEAKEENEEEFAPYLKNEDDQEEVSNKAQGSFEFELPATSTSEEEMPVVEVSEEAPVVKFNLEDEYDPEVSGNEADSDSQKDELSHQEMQERSHQRISRIKELSMKLKTPSGLSDLENEPAYKRRNVNLSDVPHSSESQVSRYTLSEEEDETGQKKTEIKPNNSFLHDNVD